jgi:hypothetical protein
VFEPVNMLIMGNGLKVDDSIEKLVNLYDLKGSTSARIEKPVNVTEQEGHTDIIKDENLLNQLDSQKWWNMYFSDEDQAQLARIMENDSLLMKKYNLMDYSLLFQINSLRNPDISFEKDDEWIKNEKDATEFKSKYEKDKFARHIRYGSRGKKMYFN